MQGILIQLLLEFNWRWTREARMLTRNSSARVFILCLHLVSSSRVFISYLHLVSSFDMHTVLAIGVHGSDRALGLSTISPIPPLYSLQHA
jgi:hypothetical protein